MKHGKTLNLTKSVFFSLWVWFIFLFFFSQLVAFIHCLSLLRLRHSYKQLENIGNSVAKLHPVRWQKWKLRYITFAYLAQPPCVWRVAVCVWVCMYGSQRVSFRRRCVSVVFVWMSLWACVLLNFFSASNQNLKTQEFQKSYRPNTSLFFLYRVTFAIHNLKVPNVWIILKSYNWVDYITVLIFFMLILFKFLYLKY